MKKARLIFNEFRDWFIREFGGVACRDVQTKLFGRYFNLMSDKELKKFHDFQKSAGVDCSLVTNKTAVKLAQMLSRKDIH